MTSVDATADATDAGEVAGAARTTGGTSGGRSAGSNGGRFGFRLGPERLKELSLLGIIGVTLVIFAFLVDDYASGRFFNRVTTSVAITALLAVAQTLVIVTRNIDLSVGSIVGVTAYVTGEVVADHPQLNPALAIGLAVALGCGMGLVNGVLVAYGKVPSIIVTLGTLSIYRSWLISHSGSKSITADSLPGWIVEFPRRTLLSAGDLQLRAVFAIALAVVIVLQLALGRLRWGRRLYAIGSNPEAAVQAGLPQRRLVLGAFVGSGALAGLAGFLFLARFGTITVSAGQGLELDAVGAAVVGGVSILGGAGTLVGALLGAVLIDLLDQSLVRTDQVSEFWRNAILGLLILVAVIGDVAIGRRFRRRWSREAEASTRAAPLPKATANGEAPVAGTGERGADARASADPEQPSQPEPSEPSDA